MKVIACSLATTDASAKDCERKWGIYIISQGKGKKHFTSFSHQTMTRKEAQYCVDMIDK